MFRIEAKVLQKIGDAPARLLLFADGWNGLEAEPGEPDRYLVDAEAFAAVVADMARRNVDLVIDYEHQTLTGDRAPAAAWIRGAGALHYEPGIGITADVDWTAQAAGYIERGEYRYISPVFTVRKRDKRLVGLHSVALTNTPKHTHMRPILAKMGSENNNNRSKEENMDFFKKLFAKLNLADGATEEETLAALDTLAAAGNRVTAVCAKLGIGADADDAAIEQAIAKLGGTERIPAAVAEALDIEPGKADTSTVVASIHALKQNGRAAADERIAALEAKLAERDAADAVAAAMSAGKITPDQKEWALEYAKKDLAGFTTFVAKAAVVVPVDKLPGKEKKTDSIVADEAVLAVAKLMGNTQEDIKKYGLPA